MNIFEYKSTSSRQHAHEQRMEFDEASQDTLTPDENLFQNSYRKGLFGFQVIVVMLLAILGLRLFYLQVTQGSAYTVQAQDNREREFVELAARGKIKDRFGTDLASTQGAFSLVAIPADLPEDQLNNLLDSLKVFNIDIEESKKKIVNARNTFEPVVLSRRLSLEDSIRFESMKIQYPGFRVIATPIRDYPDAQVFSHVLGYTSPISESDLAELTKEDKQKYSVQDVRGVGGIESSYEKILKGDNGKHIFEVDALGRQLKTVGEQAPHTGNDVYLTIDAGLQKHIYDTFNKQSPNLRGAAVALDPKTGEVLALVSLPGYDNNLFARGILRTEYQQLLDDKSLPLYNRAITGTYPPGSVVKPVVGLAGLEEKVISENTRVVDNGVLVVPNQFDHNISYNFYGWKRSGLGSMDVKSAIAMSSDIFFYTLGGGHPTSEVKGLGAQRIADYYHLFGAGDLSGIDIPGERAGVVPDPKWKAESYAGDKILSKWYLGDTYHISIGQGDMLASPLQVADWTAAIANNGTLFRPHVFLKAMDQNNNTVKEAERSVYRKIPSDQKYFDIIKSGMRQTVTSGSGRLLDDIGFSVAGKTGTSQFDGSDPKKTHAWFTSFAPYENPEIVLTIFVEAGGEGHAAAAPIAKEVLKWWYDNRVKSK